MITTPENSIRRFGVAPPRIARTGREAPPESQARDELLPPTRRGFTTIPTPEVLEQIITRAVSALRAGVYWDRGSIVNLLA